MQADDLKTLIRASIGNPVKIYVDDGSCFTVTHPDFALVSDEFLILVKGAGCRLPAGRNLAVCPLNHVSRVEVLDHPAKAA